MDGRGFLKAGFFIAREVTWRHGLFIFAVLLVLRIWSFGNPIVDADEPQFAGFAHALLDGGLPYLASVDTKPLGVYWFFALVFAIFGRFNMIAVHVATALWIGATAWLCFRIGRRLFSPRAGFWAALFYVVFTTTYIPKFIGTSIAPLMMLPLTASVDLFLSGEATRQRWRTLLSGVLWGMACLFKYQAGINLVVVWAYLFVVRPFFIDRRLKSIRITEFLLFALGGTAVGGLFALYLIEVGSWDAFVFWSLEGSAAYVEAATGQSHFLEGLFVRGGSVVASVLLIWILAGVQAVRLIADLFKRRPGPEGEAFILLWFLFSLIPVCAGGKFYGHYFVQLYPALCILSGGWMERFLGGAAEAKRWGRRLIAALVAVGIILPAGGFFVARFYADEIYAAVPDENVRDYIPVSEYIREHTREGDRIFVWGFATAIYFYSRRDAASRFLWCDWLTGRVSGTPSARDPDFDTTAFIKPGSWGMFFGDLERTKPAYLVDTSPGNWHDYGKYPISKYPALMDYLQRHYRYETTIDQMDLYRRVGP